MRRNPDHAAHVIEMAPEVAPQPATASTAATRDRVGTVGATVVEGAAGTETPPRAATDPSVAAFFDVDNTVMRGASIYYFARGLASHELFTSRDLARFGWQQLVFRVSGSESSDHVHAAREAALAFVAGQPVDELVELGEQIYDELVAKRIWEGTRALAQNHIDAGQRVWLVTATPIEMANIIARRLGLTGALGTVSEIENGVYTGRLDGELLHGPAKADAVRTLAAREGLDLARCFAYSDSINDLPMLTQVGEPRAVNADRDLREYAKQQGWPAYDFRTGRKATIMALSGAGAVGALSGVVAAALALRRRKGPGQSLALERRVGKTAGLAAPRRRSLFQRPTRATSQLVDPAGEGRNSLAAAG